MYLKKRRYKGEKNLNFLLQNKKIKSLHSVQQVNQDFLTQSRVFRF